MAMANVTPHASPYAIVGIGCRFPGGADSPAQFWQLLRDGRDAITEIPPDRPDWHRLYDADPTAAGRIYARLGGFIDGIDRFDARFFGISPREATRIDPQQRLLLEVVWHAFEDARIAPDGLAGSDVGVFIGLSTHDYADVQMYPENREAIDAHSNTGGASAIAANRISYFFDFRGPSLVVDTACSSALTAVHLACRALDSGDCSVAVAGGAQLLLRPELTVGFCRASMLSVDGRCKAFDESGNGYVRSEGAGAILLKPLERAIAEGDPIYAVIAGSAVNQDGHSAGLTVPNESAQKAMLRASLKRAGMAPADVQYVEAHGTGTAVGDPIEARAIGGVFSEGRPEAEPLLLGSVKTNIGHLEAASGIAGLIKTALAIKHRRLPPSLHFMSWNSAIDARALKLRMVTSLEEWPKVSGEPAAAVNSFGFGGANASVVLRAGPRTEARNGAKSPGRAEILTLSARTPEALRALAAAHTELLFSGDTALDAVCGAAARARSHLEHRAAIVGSTSEALANGLDSLVAGESAASVAAGRVSADAAGKIAFVFSGMGPQWWGMGRQLLEQDPVFLAVIQRCDEALRPHSDWSLLDEFRKDETTSRLAHPQLAQVTNFALQVSLAEVWRNWGITPGAVVGHSGGAMAAACLAGVHSLDDAIWLAFHRSRLQGRDSNAGEMLAVGLPAEQAAELVAGHEATISLAAVNGPASTTLAGDGTVLRDIAARLTERQIFARMLPVTIAYHSPRMDPIEGEFREAVARLRGTRATLPLVSDTTGTWEDGDGCDASYWWRAIRQPVRFADSINTLADAGYTTFVEVSPHPVLAPSISECLAARGMKGTIVPSLRRNEDDRATMLRALGTLYVNGAEPAWHNLYRRDISVPLPPYPFQRERHWFEPDEGEGGGGREAVGEADANPLLGKRTPSAEPMWETRLGAAALSYLDDHTIQGAVVFPGAGYIATALAAARRLEAKDSAVVRDVEFLRPLIIGNRAATGMQTLVDADTLKVRIRAGSTADHRSWPVYATGRLSTGSTGEPRHIDLAEQKARLREVQQPEEFYKILRQRGLNYEARFRGVTALHVGQGEALAAIGPLDNLPTDPDSVHPALLDAAFQTLAAVTDTGRSGDDRLFLPTRIDEIRLHRTAGESFWSYCRLNFRGETRVVGSFEIVNAEGQPLLSIRGFEAQLVEAGAGESEIGQLLYDYRWEPKPIEITDEAPRRPALFRAEPSSIASGMADRTIHIEEATGWPRYYTDADSRISEFAAAQIVPAFKALGVPMTPGATIPVHTIGEVKANDGSQGLWTDRLLGLLEETGCIEATADGWRVVRVPSIDGLTEGLSGYETDLALLAEAGRTLPAALREGRSKDVLFTPEALQHMSRFYEDAPASAFYNRVLADAVTMLLANASPSGCLRVLEVGAGTGGATGALLGCLPQERTRYIFTDNSALLLDAAAKRFEDVACLETHTLDITADVEAQGFHSGSFDLIVAANVVHATPDVAATLTQLHSLLAPGGVLAMIEITRHPRWLDVIFGQTAEWWDFRDRHLRREHPLLESAEWEEQLKAAGFTGIWLSREPGARGEPAQTVMFAAKPAEEARRPWLIVGETGKLIDTLAAELRSAGHLAVTAGRGDISATLDSIQAAPVAILHLGMQRLPGEADADFADTRSALSLIQTLLSRQLRDTPIVLVTAGASRLPNDPGDDVFQSPIWGIARTVMKEHPELDLRLVDIGQQYGACEVQALLREVTEHDNDEEVALRGSERYVRRLRRVDVDALAPRPQSATAEKTEWRAAIGTRGSLASLQVKQFRPSRLEPDQVQIAVKAASLNFRDVMLAMGGIPGLEDEMSFGHRNLGSDCAGVVTAVGEKVRDIRPGDAVLGMAPGSICSVTSTSELLVVRKPDTLGFEEAASIPTTFLTAFYALVRLAALRKGERVLIHAATGGVGLAAIQIAKDIGAEIFATAGSEAKRDHLHSLGVAHVMDSRTLVFADEIAGRTGGRGVDVVLNSLSGEAIERGIDCLGAYGRFIEIGKLDIYTNRNLPLRAFRRNLSYFAADLDRICAERPDIVGEMLREVMTGFDAGRFRPVARHDFEMSRMEEAFRLMAQAKHIGKIVLRKEETPPSLPSVAELGTLLRSDGTCLITGGLGGFGLEVAEHLAGGDPGAIVLMGRRPPGDAALRRIEALRQRGIWVEVMQGDVSRAPDVDAVLERIENTLPPLCAVFHGAMVLDDRPIEQIDAEALERVMAPKAWGAWLLHERTLNRPLDHFVMFSSISAVLGNPLQANYSAASAFLDALAHHRRARGLPALAINWGVLSGYGYVAERPELLQFLDQQGYAAFQPRQALAVLDVLLARDAGQIMAAKVDWRRLAAYAPQAAASPRIADLVPHGDAGVGEDAATSEIVLALAAAPEEERPALVEAFLAEVLGRVLGTAAAEIEAERPFDELGLDSLLAVEFMVALNSEFSCEMPVIALLDGMTVRKLAGLVLAEMRIGESSTVKGSKTSATRGRAVPAHPERAAAEEVRMEPALRPSSPLELAVVDLTAPANDVTPANEARSSEGWSPGQGTIRSACKAIFRALGNISVEGIENLPATGPFILAVNHLSMADVPLALTVMPRRTIVLANERLKQSPLLHWFVGRMGQAIYVAKGGDTTATLEQALQVLRDGGVIALAPEGTRNRGGLGRAKTGVARLAQKAGVPVVPYVAWGQERWRERFRSIAPLQIHVRIGTPLRPPPATAGDADIREHADDVMRALAAMLPEAYRGVYAGPEAAHRSKQAA
jgi:1-acyl-sn-glycerol-3-phosphate acyltransferase